MSDLKCIGIALSLIFVLLSCDQHDISNIPFISVDDIKIDGILAEGEWEGSRKIRVTATSFLFLSQNDEYLYVGVKNVGNVSRYLDLYLDNESMGTLNLHASMQLGERLLKEGWNDTIPAWNWGNNTNWEANIVEVISDDETISFQQSVKPYEGHEFKISKRKFTGRHIRMRLEIKDFMGQASDIIFPADSERADIESWLDIMVE